jgi:hypothetical protein
LPAETPNGKATISDPRMQSNRRAAALARRGLTVTRLAHIVIFAVDLR